MSFLPSHLASSNPAGHAFHRTLLPIPIVLTAFPVSVSDLTALRLIVPAVITFWVANELQISSFRAWRAQEKKAAA